MNDYFQTKSTFFIKSATRKNNSIFFNLMIHSINDDFDTFVLKSAQGTNQQLKKRQKYEVQPRFIKAGLFYQSKYANVRQHGVAQRISVCEILKSKGTKNFTKGLLEEATRDYEQVGNIVGIY